MLIFDYKSGDFIHALSDSMAMDSEGNFMMKLSNYVAMDMGSGNLHMTSLWPSDDGDDW